MLRRRIKRRKQLEEVSNFTSVRFTKEGQPTLTPLHSMMSPDSLNGATYQQSEQGETQMDGASMPNPQNEGDLNAEELFVQGQEAYDKALHLWQQSLKKARDNDGLALQIKSILSQAQSIPNTSVSFSTTYSELMQTAPTTQESDSDTASFRSFSSDFDEIPLPLTGDLSAPHLYHIGLQKAEAGQVPCRTMRTVNLLCDSDADFLAKLYSVRLAFKHLLQSREVSSRFKDIGLEAMSTFFTMAGRDAKPFCLAFDTVVTFVEDPGNWDVMKEELTERRVVDITFYDVVLDFTLLDAFDDLDNLPSTIVSVLQNHWLTDGMKESALNAGIWTMIKAKKSMLKHSNGFMMKFYAISEVLTPTLAWGFLGTNPRLVGKCRQFKTMILDCLRTIFSLEKVRYHNRETLAEDIYRVFLKTVESVKQELQQQQHTQHHNSLVANAVQ